MIHFQQYQFIMSQQSKIKDFNLKWSGEDISLARFLVKYGDRLPVMITVTSGFLGNNDILHTFSAGEVIMFNLLLCHCLPFVGLLSLIV